MLHPCQRRAMNRRHFITGSAAGLGVGVVGGAMGWKLLSPPTAKIGEIPNAKLATLDRLPGSEAHRGRVVEVRHPRAVDELHRIDRLAVRDMLDQGMCAFTGADHASEAWKKFFEPDDVIGIKVNPVGSNKSRPTVAGSISSFEVVLEIVRNLRAIGVPTKNIILFERYAREFVDTGYEALLRERDMEGVRWYCSAAQYTDTQIAIDGIEDRSGHSPELLKHVVGYDPDAFVHMGFAAPEHSQRDDRRFRSHLSNIVTRLVNKFITIPVLKDHRSAGVTLSLKNLSHGLNNNVARSHLHGFFHGYPTSPGRSYDGPNQCNVFIPTAVNQPAIREKATLHILDGLVAVYEGGPGVWNKSWGTWRANRLFVATDPVALDHIGWDIIDNKRVEVGLPRVGEISRQHFTPTKKAQMIVSPFGAGSPLEAISKTASAEFVRSAGDTEVFDRRTPEHVILAAMVGLGEFKLNKITHRIVTCKTNQDS